MPPVEVTADYYAILEVPQTATFEVIKMSYRRLAKVLHPDKNPHKPDATACFQSLGLAYETVSDPPKRRAYDDQYVRIKNSQRTREKAEKRQAEAAEREGKRAAEEKVGRQKEESARKQRLQSLEALRAEYERGRFELNRVIRRLQVELKRLQELDDEETRKEKEKHSWWAYVTSPIYGKAEEPEEQKRKREAERLQRHHSKNIKQIKLSQKETEMESVKNSWLDVHGKIEAEKKREEDEAKAQAAKRQEQLRKEEEARRLAAEELRHARWAQLQKEQAARAAKEAREAKEAQEARDRARRAEEEARRKAEMEEYERAVRTAEEAREARERSYQPAASSYRTSASNTSTCRHNIYWTKIDGVHTCSNCHNVQRRFAFQCPGCTVVACASCRDTLKGKGRRRRNIYTPRGPIVDDDDLFTDYGYD